VSNIIYTKVKFVRNLKDCSFESNINDDEQNKILQLGLKAVSECGLKCLPLSDINKTVIDNLLAQDLLEHEFVYVSYNQGCANNGNVTVEINNKNHIEIFAKDKNIYDAYVNAKEVDKKLCNKLNFAYNDKYGFLTPDIKCIGSGMSVEIKIMLPALAQIGALSKLPNSNEKMVFDLTCLDRQSGLCLITTRVTLGYTEKQICELTKMYIDKIIQLEIETSKRLAEDSDDVDDKSRRAKAILKNCIKISGSEAYVLLGYILISINAGIEKECTAEQINNSLNYIKLYENNFNILAKEIQKILK
jgi:protein arginine kinase